MNFPLERKSYTFQKELKYLNLAILICVTKINTLLNWKGLVTIQKLKVGRYHFFHKMYHFSWIGLKGYENDQNNKINWLNTTCFPYCKSVLPEGHLYRLIAILIRRVLLKRKTNCFKSRNSFQLLNLPIVDLRWACVKTWTQEG